LEALSTEVVVAKGRETGSNAPIVKTCTVCVSRPDMTVASLINRSLEEIRVPMDSNNSFLRWHNVEKFVHCLEVPEHAPRQENGYSHEQRVEHEGMVA